MIREKCRVIVTSPSLAVAEANPNCYEAMATTVMNNIVAVTEGAGIMVPTSVSRLGHGCAQSATLSREVAASDGTVILSNTHEPQFTVTAFDEIGV